MASTTLVYIHYSLLPTALLFEQQHVKGASIVDHVTPPHGKMSGRSIPDDCERTATVALPTAASAGFISGELGTSAALDAFSTVYELLLTRFENRQTYGHEQSLYLALLAMPTRGNELTSQPLCHYIPPRGSGRESSCRSRWARTPARSCQT